MARLSAGNPKTGRSVLTYSRTPAVTCPGASDWCNAADGGACYAKKAYRQYDNTRAQWDVNAALSDVPELPSPKRNGGITMLRIHVSGDFDTPAYVMAWYFALKARPDVHAWAYTRSWTVPALIPSLEKLRTLDNVQMFASIDPTMAQTPPEGWRVAVIEGDTRFDAPVCMEQKGTKATCADCGYCWKGKRGNILFLAH